MKWRELTPDEYLALEAALEDFDFAGKAKHTRELDASTDNSSIYQSLARGYTGMTDIKERLLEMDSPPQILIKLSDDN